MWKPGCTKQSPRQQLCGNGGAPSSPSSWQPCGMVRPAAPHDGSCVPPPSWHHHLQVLRGGSACRVFTVPAETTGPLREQVLRAPTSSSQTLHAEAIWWQAYLFAVYLQGCGRLEDWLRPARPTWAPPGHSGRSPDRPAHISSRRPRWQVSCLTSTVC